MNRAIRTAALLSLLILFAGCSDDGGNGAPNPDGSTPDLSTTDGNKPTEGGTPDDGGKGDAGKACGFTVGDTLKGTVGDNKDFLVGGEKRTFIVQLVNVPQGYSKKLPVIFGYHGTGSYYNIPTKYYTPVSENRPFIYVAPKGSGPFEDPYDFNSDPSKSKDIKLFDDLIACLKAQFDVDTDHIHAFGFSWGGHWINYLLAHRGDVLASTAQLSSGMYNPSGSVYESLLQKFAHKPAQLVIWGGASDTYNGYSFDQNCKNTVTLFRKVGLFVLQCVHDSGHDITPPESLNKFIFEFFQDHPRGVSPDPYLSWPPPAPFTKGTYLSWPTWCKPAP
jgi:predicted esterase